MCSSLSVRYGAIEMAAIIIIIIIRSTKMYTLKPPFFKIHVVVILYTSHTHTRTHAHTHARTNERTRAHVRQNLKPLVLYVGVSF